MWSESQFLDISSFEKKRTQGERDGVRNKTGNYNIIILESQEKTEFQDISKLNATHKERLKVL